jgi:hypothetical protein
MAVSVAQTFRITAPVATGTLTRVNAPPGIDVYEALLTSSAAFAVASNAAGPSYPVAANDSIRIPVTLDTMPNESTPTQRGLFISGSGTVSIMWLGLSSVSGYTNS